MEVKPPMAECLNCVCKCALEEIYGWERTWRQGLPNLDASAHLWGQLTVHIG